MLLPIFLLIIFGLLSNLAVLFSLVLEVSTFNLLRPLSFGAVVAERGIDVLILVATLEVFAELICLRGSILVLLFAIGGDDFGLLIRVVMREVLAAFMRAGGLGGALVFATAAGVLVGRTDATMREVFAGLTCLGVAGFASFGVAGAGEGLEILWAGAILRGGAETLGGLERGADLLGLGAVGFATAGGGLLRFGRVEARGAG